MYKIVNMKLTDLLIIDIETIPDKASYGQLDDAWKQLFNDKATKTVPFQGNIEEIYKKRAGIWAEFGKVVCIGAGFFLPLPSEQWELQLFSFSSHIEVQILRDFTLFCETWQPRNREFRFAGHNIREFDIPFLGRRMLINRLPLPESLRLQDKKPWEVSHFDTLGYWKFGDYKNYISLHLLANVLQIPSPKQGISGADVQDLYYQQNNLQGIVDYCKQDVLATARIIQRLMNLPPVEDSQVKSLQDPNWGTMFTTLS
jgi:hypothetical protein